MDATDTFVGPVPADALAWFRAKDLRPGFDHRETWMEEHVKSFTAAWSMKMAVTAALKNEFDRSLEYGLTLRDFQKNVMPLLEKEGWVGKKSVEHDGETKERELGTPRRLKLIYETNMRTSRAAGQWQRIQRTADVRPYLLYSLGPSERHRPIHQSWAGTLLPADHPFWQVAFPPNGWGCKCRVRQVGNAEAARLGGPTESPRLEPVTWTKTDAPETKLQGIKGIDPGWDYNPGAVRQPRSAKSRNDRDPAADLVRREMHLTQNTAVKRRRDYEDSAHRLSGVEARKRLMKGGAAHVFMEHVDLDSLVQEALLKGSHLGREAPNPAKTAQFHRIRYDTGRLIGLKLSLSSCEAIRQIELKLRQDNSGGWIYHVIPRYVGTGAKMKRPSDD